MLGKLMKYELKACGRIFVPLYVAILVVAAIIGVFSNTESFQVASILIFILMALFIGLMVVTIVLIIQRFKKSLLEDEGYLMFTLPVSIKNLILSKYLTSYLYNFKYNNSYIIVCINIIIWREFRYKCTFKS